MKIFAIIVLLLAVSFNPSAYANRELYEIEKIEKKDYFSDDIEDTEEVTAHDIIETFNHLETLLEQVNSPRIVRTVTQSVLNLAHKVLNDE